MEGLFFSVSRWKTCGVETGCSGLAMMQWKDGMPDNRAIFSPTPLAISGLPTMHIGISAPSFSASLSSVAAAGVACQWRSSARSVAAASAEPPPMPEAMGRFFSR